MHEMYLYDTIYFVIFLVKKVTFPISHKFHITKYNFLSLLFYVVLKYFSQKKGDTFICQVMS